jgi:purine-binding chemotaxis protein CheW
MELNDSLDHQSDYSPQKDNGHRQPGMSPTVLPIANQAGKSQPIFARSNGEYGDPQTGLDPADLARLWARRAYELAEEPPPPATGQTLDLLIFTLNGERYGLDVSNVREIYPLQQLTPVPRTPDFVTGVFSARGRILSIVDLRSFMGLPAIGLSDQTKIIVVANTDPASETVQMEIGLLADEVADVITIFKADIEPPLTGHTEARLEYIQGVTTDLLVVVDLNALLSDKRLIVYEEILK